MTPDIHCSRASLEQLLAEALPEQLEHELSDHLSACPDCRGELEALAAGEAWWTEASQRLSARRPLSDDETDHDADAAHFATDFAVDFLEASEDAENLGRLGEYEIVGIIGRGGMGIVLKGFQKELHRHVALKVLSPHLATSGAARRRFAREAQATAAVVHPHVMAIHSVNATAKLPYLVMPFVACQSLQERLDRNGPLDVIDILRIGLQAALGLAAAHAQGLVHRDVKPANILLETNVDRVLLTDFGLARAVDDATLTRTGIIAGTPQYMSPEQANGDAVDHRSDLFSLGAVLYAMCTGRPPFRAETTFGVLRRIRETSPREIREINAEIPDWLCRVVMKLLEKKQSDRLSSAQEVAALLEQCLAHVQQPTAVPLPAVVYPWLVSREPSVRPQTSKRKWYFAFVAASIFITGGVWWLMQRPDVPAGPVLETVFPERQPAPTAEPTVDPLTEWNALQNELTPAAELIEQLEKSVNADLNLVEPEFTSPPPSRAKEEL
ncbi:MAG: serine/threonine-protein kinase [Planctomycetaceae bacterium]